MTAIFGSLGSNYSLVEAVQYFLPVRSPSQTFDQLKSQIKQLWPGEIFFFYKGRQAITCALTSLNLAPGSGVLLTAFTCQAIEDAIMASGCVPIYADIAPGTTNAGVSQLQAAFDHSQQTCKALIVQHTLGIPADITNITAWAKDKGMFMIEDLAQAAGAVDGQSHQLGQKADIIILSFGQDKILDAVSGGACIFNIIDQNQQKQAISRAQIFSQACQSVPRTVQLRDSLYPKITWLIRQTYNFKIGQFFMVLCKMLGLLRSPVLPGVKGNCHMTARSARLVSRRLNQLKPDLARRAELDRIYQSKLARLAPISTELLDRSSHQRFLITIPQRDRLVAYLSKHQIYLSDIWYRSSVDSGSLHLPSQYQPGSCPQAEALAQVCFNLPTHRYISTQTAAKIADLVLSFNQRKLL